MKELIKMLKEDSVLDFNTRFKKLLEYKLYCETLNEKSDCAYLAVDYGDYKKGTEVEILDSEDGVYKIKFPDGEKDSMVKSLLNFNTNTQKQLVETSEVNSLFDQAYEKNVNYLKAKKLHWGNKRKINDKLYSIEFTPWDVTSKTPPLKVMGISWLDVFSNLKKSMIN